MGHRATTGRTIASSLPRRWGVVATLVGLLLVISIGIASGRAQPVASQRVLSIGLALATGDLGDRAFNDSAYAALQHAQRTRGVRFRVVAWKGAAAQTQNIRELAAERHDLIIAIGQENAAAIKTVAAEYPTQRFALVDNAVDAPNVTSVVFRELEGDFLAGALTALLSPSGTVGFLGGADIPLIRRIEHGWSEGVRYVNPHAQIVSAYASGKDDFSGFNKPDVGMQLAATMYARHADVVYAAAGRTALGAITAAQQQRRLVITTGSDQRWIAPDVVVTSRTKNMDTAIGSLIADVEAGQLAPGTRTLDLASGGVSLAPLDGRDLSPAPPLVVPSGVIDRIATIQNDLVEGKIRVAEYQP